MKRWNWLIAAGLITFAAATEAQAFDQTQYQAVKNGDKACPWCNLSAANLANANLAGADLTGADLTGADLTKVDLTGADLTGAVLAGAVLSGANFLGADPDQVDLSGAVIAGARLENANCDWATSFPKGSGLVCVGVTVERE